MGAGGHYRINVQNDPVNWIDPYGLELSDILPGIQTAIAQGAQGGAFAVGQAANATADIAMNGHPLAQTALGVAFFSEAAPLAGAAAISAFPAVTSAVYNIAPYSGAIGHFAYGFFVATGPPNGWGYLSSGALTLYDIIKEMLSDQNSSPCGN